MKNKIKRTLVGLALSLYISFLFLGGAFSIIDAFFQDKTWAGILLFIFGIAMTILGIIFSYYLGDGIERLAEKEDNLQ